MRSSETFSSTTNVISYLGIAGVVESNEDGLKAVEFLTSLNTFEKRFNRPVMIASD
jgi:hypothetical protein